MEKTVQEANYYIGISAST